MPRDGSRACFVTGGAAVPGWSGASSCSYQASLPLPAFPAPKKATFNPKSGARPGWGVVRAALDACHSWTELWLVSAWRGVARCGVFFAPSLWGGVGGVVPCVGSRWVPLGWDNKTPWEKSGFCAAVGPPAPGGRGQGWQWGRGCCLHGGGQGTRGAVGVTPLWGQGWRWVPPWGGDTRVAVGATTRGDKPEGAPRSSWCVSCVSRTPPPCHSQDGAASLSKTHLPAPSPCDDITPAHTPRATPKMSALPTFLSLDLPNMAPSPCRPRPSA